MPRRAICRWRPLRSARVRSSALRSEPAPEMATATPPSARARSAFGIELLPELRRFERQRTLPGKQRDLGRAAGEHRIMRIARGFEVRACRQRCIAALHRDIADQDAIEHFGGELVDRARRGARRPPSLCFGSAGVCARPSPAAAATAVRATNNKEAKDGNHDREAMRGRFRFKGLRIAGPRCILGYICPSNKRHSTPPDARTSGSRNDASRDRTSRRTAESDGGEDLRPPLALAGSPRSAAPAGRPRRRPGRPAQQVPAFPARPRHADRPFRHDRKPARLRRRAGAAHARSRRSRIRQRRRPSLSRPAPFRRDAVVAGRGGRASAARRTRSRAVFAPVSTRPTCSLPPASAARRSSSR